MDFNSAVENAYAVGDPRNVVSVGVMGTARIARSHLWGIQGLEGVKVHAVASRSIEKANAFADEFGIPTRYGKYEDLLKDDKIDAVYIPLPSSLHLEWVVKAAKCNKHVLLEKPCAWNSDELLTMLETCRENKVKFMDTVFFMHHSRLKQISQQLANASLGPDGPTHVLSTFCFRGDESFFQNNIRVAAGLDKLGCLGDLAWYSIRIALFAFNWDLPETVSATYVIEKDGVPFDMNGSMLWKSKAVDGCGIPIVRSTMFHCSFVHAWQEDVLISGQDGTLAFEDFVIPRSTSHAPWFIRTNIDQTRKPSGMEWSFNQSEHNVGETKQERQLWQAFRNHVLNEDNKGAFWPGISLLTQLCVDALHQSAANHGAQTVVDPGHLWEKFTKLYNI
uniref:Gfo/Idh/MocA-like oxidoreductase N-terminal domain-containing protein n=1 Tax=Mucochytrium quahogii TaxID=96639 RepID=A0A7S2R7N4_9STRA|mmetsp:Transcript_24324/g.39446  ORF Transcript_24324/g.39446 Transcript_24324/m.39446 type:complete len:391 (-) Transcript_24324:109-1281(-)